MYGVSFLVLLSSLIIPCRNRSQRSLACFTPSPSFLASSVKVGLSRANGVLPKVQRASRPEAPAAAQPGHLPARAVG
jgi:hypothetical protein